MWQFGILPDNRQKQPEGKGREDGAAGMLPDNRQKQAAGKGFTMRDGKNKEIKNVVFDVGDVLIHFRYRDYMKDLGFPEEEINLFEEKAIRSDYWKEMDRGFAKEDKAAEYFSSEMPEYAADVVRFMDGIEAIVREYDYAFPLLSAIRNAGYGVYILSNYPDKLSDLHWKHFRFLEAANGKLISAKEKLAKPDAAFYRLLSERFGLSLSECLFVDDREINVEAAKNVGMQAVLFQGLEPLLQSLSDYGIQIEINL